MVPSGDYPPAGQSFVYLEQDPMVASLNGGMNHLAPGTGVPYGKQAAMAVQHRVSPNSSEASSTSGADPARTAQTQSDGRSPHLIMQQNHIAALRQRHLMQQRQQGGQDAPAQMAQPGIGGMPAYPQPSSLQGHPGMQPQHGMSVQSYGMAPQQQTYNHQDRRASSPAAMFVPSGSGPSQTSMMGGSARPIPPPLLHHHMSDYSQNGAPWQDGYKQPFPVHQQHQPMPGPPPGYGSMQAYPAYGGGYPMPPHESMAPRPAYGYPPQMAPGHPLHGQYIMEDEDGDDYGNPRQPFDPYRVKHRKRTSPEQLAVLEAAFDQNSKPSAVERKSISEQIGMTSRAVQVWFQNRRQKKKLAERKQLDSAAEAAENEMYGPPGSSMVPSINVGGQPGYYGPPATSGSPSGRGVPSSIDIIDNDDLGWSTTPANGIHHPGHDVPVHLRMNPAMRPQPPPLSVMNNSGRGSPMISQARRGSLPYPPPQASAVNQQSPHMRAGYSNTLGVPLPPHLTPSGMDRRRSSLPGNPRSISSKSLTFTRRSPVESVQMAHNGSQSSAGRQSNLSPIADQDRTPEPEGGSKQNHHSESPISAGADIPPKFAAPQPGFVMPSGLQGDQLYVMSGAGPLFAQNYAMGPAPQVQQVGPLPNPSFSFGSGGDGDLPKDAYAQPGGAAEVPPFHPASIFRGRMGSMASILSQATTDGGATTDGTSSDWDRVPGAYAAYQQAIAPVDMSLQTPQDEVPKTLANAQTHLSAVPPGFQADLRRASAPAELLAKFSGLDVELPGGLPHRPSPLGAAVITSPDEPDDAGQQAKTPNKASPSTSAKTVSPPVAAATTQPPPDQAGTSPSENSKTAGSISSASAAENALLYSAGVQGERVRNESIDINYMYPSSGGTGFTPILGGDFGQFNEEWMYGALGSVHEGREEEAS